MKTFILSVALLLSVLSSFSQVINGTQANLSNGNTTGAEQNVLNLGNLSNPVTTPTIRVFTNDFPSGNNQLRFHSSRLAGGILLTREGSGGPVKIMDVSGFDGAPAGLNLYTASTNQADIVLRSSSDSYLLSGNLAIGSTTAYGYRLAVNGAAIFTSARVKLFAHWPDYVFKKEYKLMPLAELESFIQKNSHLPEIPCEAEVKKDGLDLGSNQAALLKKIEELTLYIIDQNKRIEKLEALVNDSKQ